MPSAAIYDCEGAQPNDAELAFFKEVNPAGFILFADHCATPDAARRHVDTLKDALGRDDLLFLVDQEGGRVARMRPPAFPAHPPMAVFGKLWRLDPNKAREAAHLNGKLLGQMCSSLGVNVDCVPMLDIPQIDSDTVVIGDRAFAGHCDQVIELGRATAQGLIEGGAMPVIKHLPGHGRALCDSHYGVPCIDARAEDLNEVDFAPFRAMADTLMGMTGHVVLEAYDKALPATLSKTVIDEIIRGRIGFDGLLFSDDLRMGALSGYIEELGARSGACLEAGCDIALCCNFTLDEKIAAAKGIGDLEGRARARLDRVLEAMPKPAAEAGTSHDYERLEALIRPALNA